MMYLKYLRPQLAARSTLALRVFASSSFFVAPFSSSSAPPPQLPPLTEVDFHKLADSTLETLELNVTSLEDSIDGFDLSLAMGVLTLSLGAKGTYVFNKQTPNKQIWWSSPLSGPRRYAWDAGKQRWVSTRDGHDMLNTLEGELKGLLGKAVQFK